MKKSKSTLAVAVSL